MELISHYTEQKTAFYDVLILKELCPNEFTDYSGIYDSKFFSLFLQYMGNALSAIVFTAYTSKRCCVACDTVKIVRY